MLSGRSVEIMLPPDLPLLSVDAVLLQQVFLNLLENAMKYTPARSPIEIRARANGSAMVITVDDRGPGLPPGAESRVFEKFFRADTSSVSGAGLGLAICRGVVEAHGGTISAKNRVGGGASFAIALPISGEAPFVPAEVDAASVGGAS
jgi:two-component system sensor histidine kinase KdpD